MTETRLMVVVDYQEDGLTLLPAVGGRDWVGFGYLAGVWRVPKRRTKRDFDTLEGARKWLRSVGAEEVQ
ncbi:MAG TPA: hypothetical protein VM537_15505 [Anaerolineae bacterium]|nr:hypothetical protein [Anaerolineae bacterium]